MKNSDSIINHIFQPIQIGSLTVPNRIVMAPMTRGFSPNGIPGQDVSSYYRRRAEGNVGLIITEGIGIDHPAAIGDSGLGDGNQPILHGEAALNQWKTIVDNVHAAGGLIAPQLWHQGPLRINDTGLHPDALSCRPSPSGGPADRTTSFSPEVVAKLNSPTKAMSDSDIADTIAAYTRSAANAKAVGFDAIALHGAHSYLIDAFLWADTNQRTDRWGGDLRNRTRYGTEVVKSIRAEIGPDMPIIFRFSQWKQSDFLAQIAKNPSELEIILDALSGAGVDIFDASTRRYEKAAFPDIDKYLTLAGWAKKITGKPAIAVGGIGLDGDLYDSMKTGGSASSDNIYDVAERIEKGEFDFAAVGRALISDPDWVKKLKSDENPNPFNLTDLAELV